MNIYFIRHGDPDYSTDSLTELGHEQAKLLAEAIKDLKIDEVYQSSMGRAQQTCDYSAKKWGLTPVTIDWAKELCWGDKSGNAWASESPWNINERMIKNEHKYPNGETWKNLTELQNDRIIEDIENRCIYLDKFLEEHGYVRENQLYHVLEKNDKNIAVFCHGGVICDFISHITNVPFFQFIAHVGLGVTSVSKIKLSGNQNEYCAGQIAFLNDSKHLGKY